MTHRLSIHRYCSAILICLFCSLIYAIAQTTHTGTRHTVQKGETVYGIARKYGTTVQELLKLNPGLEAEKVQIGQVINVGSVQQQTSASPGYSTVKVGQAEKPDYKVTYKEYKVKRKDTAYSIAKANGITVDELVEANPTALQDGSKLKKGTILRIPVKTKLPQPKYNGLETVRVAVILPLLGTGVEHVRSVEFYRGFLMGVEQLKMAGTNVFVSVFNEPAPDKSVASTVRQAMDIKPDLIVGPLYPSHFTDVAAVSSKATKVAIPFSSKVPQVDFRPEVFVVNTPAAYENELGLDLFTKTFNKETGVVILSGTDGSKRVFCNAMKNWLTRSEYDVTNLASSMTAQAIASILAGKKHSHYVLVVDDTSEASLNLLLTKAAELRQVMSGKDISVLGYDAWVKHAEGSHKDRVHAADMYLMTSSYYYPGHTASASFAADYKRWFKADFVESTPRMAPLGYDLARSFLGNLATYGHDFSTHSPLKGSVAAQTQLQSDIRFMSVGSNGGYVSRSMWLIHYKRDKSIVKISAP